MEKINDYTIAESYTIPSKGMVYDAPVKASVKVRSMTAEDEMKRLASSDTPYKLMSDLIESCLIEKPGISVYDMCIGDYEFLLHKLRIVTYGPEYKMSARCPECNNIFTTTYNLDDLAIKEYTEDFDKAKVITLPMTGKLVELNFQTPRTLDNIARRKRDILSKNPEMTTDPGIILTLAAAICKMDGQVLREDQKEAIVRKLPMRDANYLLQSAIKLNEMVGLDTAFTTTCPHCNAEIQSTFRITPEFFSPSI